MTFSEKLVRLRKIKGITQEDLATEVGVTRQAVYKWESGKGYPEVAALLKLKETFSISIDDLLDDSFEVEKVEGKSIRRKKAALKDEIPVTDSIVQPKTDMSEEIENETVSEVVEEKTETPTEIPIKDNKKSLFSRLFGRK